MSKKWLFISLLAAAGFALSSPDASALPAGGLGITGEASGTLVQKVWHSGLPHRRIIGNRVYGGRCPPQGCPAWTQRDLRRDRHTGEWYSPRNERRRYENHRRAQRGYYGEY